MLFVHGIQGTPASFEHLASRLDRSRFQPWFYYYPSGVHLHEIADHLTQTVAKVTRRHPHERIVVVAHSMGGLVTRGFILRHASNAGAAKIPLFVTISTPWDGHKGAEIGVKRSPVVVRVWEDMSPGSEYLRDIFARIADTAVTTLRIHTRFPIAIPERVDSGLTRLLRGTRLKTVLVVHANHANELDASVERALAELKPALTALLNQSVLLRGVNDDADTLAALSERLFACGALPYYLHLLDRVTGAAHFDVDETVGKFLIAALRSRLPGYLVPRLVRETPGQLSKTVVA